MSSEHVEVLRHMKETIKAIMPSEVAALDAAIASLSAQQSGDWVLVPREATPEMWEAGMNCHSPDDTQGDYLEKAWDAMLDAAPQPPAEAPRCTCPSGDGSLRWPCPAHPPEAQPPPSSPVGVEAALRDALQGLIDFIEIDNLPMDADAMFIAKRALAQQPAAVDGAMERVRLGPSRLWQADLVGGQISVERMRDILAFALAAQQGGRTDE